MVRRRTSRPFLGTTPQHAQWLCKFTEGVLSSVLGMALHVLCYSGTTKLILRPWYADGCPVQFVSSTGGAWLHWAVYTAWFDLSLITQVRCMLTNPGAVPPNALPNPDDVALHEEAGEAAAWLEERDCRRCQAFKPTRAHHDSVTGRCIVKLDHYCELSRKIRKPS